MNNNNSYKEAMDTIYTKVRGAGGLTGSSVYQQNNKREGCKNVGHRQYKLADKNYFCFSTSVQTYTDTHKKWQTEVPRLDTSTQNPGQENLGTIINEHSLGLR